MENTKLMFLEFQKIYRNMEFKAVGKKIMILEEWRGILMEYCVWIDSYGADIWYRLDPYGRITTFDSD